MEETPLLGQTILMALADMKMNVLRHVAGIAIVVMGASAAAQAADPLGKDEVTKRVSGKTMAWYSEKSTVGDRPRIKFGVDGEYSLTHRGTGASESVETGTWHVTDKGKLCVTAQGKSRGKCFFLIPTGGDSYMLREDPGTGD